MIYLDHAATTPIDEAVRKSMCPYFVDHFGNPSSIYSLGREAKDALCEARHTVAKLLGTEKPGEIVFTSGATESNNLAIKGVAFYASQVLGIKPHIMISSIEHHCVLDTAKYLEKYFGFDVSYIPVDHEGIVDLEYIRDNIRENTAVISVMYGNNEVGSIQPIAEIAKVVQKARSLRLDAENKLPLIFHTDAVQAFQYIGIDVADLGVDMLSLTAHKFYGPKGIGLLYVKRGAKFLPQQQGGAQENRQRAGTENVPYIVGLAAAMAGARKQSAISNQHAGKLRDYLIDRVTTEIPDVELLGPLARADGSSRPGKNTAKRLPHIAAFLFKRIEGESILINLDMLGIAASSGSACTSGSLEPSHVTKAMGVTDMDAHGAIRFSLGKMNTKEEIDELMKHLPKIVEKLRAMSPIR
jgi:cysteine desulfurase